MGFVFSLAESLAQENLSTRPSLRTIPIRYLEEVVNEQRIELLPEIFAEDCLNHGMNGNDTYQMKNGSLAAFLATLFKAFPDLHYQTGPVLEEGDLVALYCTATGTHQAEFLNIPAKGNPVSFKEIFIFRVRNGKIAESWSVVDVLGVQTQMTK